MTWADSPVAGKSVEEAGLRGLPGLFVASIQVGTMHFAVLLTVYFTAEVQL